MRRPDVPDRSTVVHYTAGLQFTSHTQLATQPAGFLAIATAALTRSRNELTTATSTTLPEYHHLAQLVRSYGIIWNGKVTSLLRCQVQLRTGRNATCVLRVTQVESQAGQPWTNRYVMQFHTLSINIWRVDKVILTLKWWLEFLYRNWRCEVNTTPPPPPMFLN